MICPRCNTNLPTKSNTRFENNFQCNNCKLYVHLNYMNFGLHFNEFEEYKNSKYESLKIYWNTDENKTSICFGSEYYRFKLLPFDLNLERIEKLLVLK
jgi:hypothetical protein